jgi:hypothetical protein
MIRIVIRKMYELKMMKILNIMLRIYLNIVKYKIICEIGDWGLGPIPNPQSPIPNPQSPIPMEKLF